MLMRHVSKDVVKSAIFIVASSSQLLKSVIKGCLSITSVRVEGVEIPELLHGQQLLLELVLKHEVHEGVGHLVQSPHGPVRPPLAAEHQYVLYPGPHLAVEVDVPRHQVGPHQASVIVSLGPLQLSQQPQGNSKVPALTWQLLSIIKCSL